MSLRRNRLLNLLNSPSIPSIDRYKAIKKTGRKLMKYLEVIKWYTFKTLQNRKRLTGGKIRRARRMRQLLLFLEKNGKTIKGITEVISRGI
jgi:hypothetical protein